MVRSKNKFSFFSVDDDCLIGETPKRNEDADAGRAKDLSAFAFSNYSIR